MVINVIVHLIIDATIGCQQMEIILGINVMIHSIVIKLIQIMMVTIMTSFAKEELVIYVNRILIATKLKMTNVLIGS